MVKRWTGLGLLLGMVWLVACGSPPAPAETPPTLGCTRLPLDALVRRHRGAQRPRLVGGRL